MAGFMFTMPGRPVEQLTATNAFEMKRKRQITWRAWGGNVISDSTNIPDDVCSQFIKPAIAGSALWNCRFTSRRNKFLRHHKGSSGSVWWSALHNSRAAISWANWQFELLRCKMLHNETVLARSRKAQKRSREDFVISCNLIAFQHFLFLFF